MFYTFIILAHVFFFLFCTIFLVPWAFNRCIEINLLEVLYFLIILKTSYLIFSCHFVLNILLPLPLITHATFLVLLSMKRRADLRVLQV